MKGDDEGFFAAILVCAALGGMAGVGYALNCQVPWGVVAGHGLVGAAIGGASPLVLLWMAA